MTYQELYNKICEVLNESGIMIELGEDDYDLREYILDSLQFITFIVSLEQTLEIEIGDELLQYDEMASLNNFCYRIYETINERCTKTE